MTNKKPQPEDWGQTLCVLEASGIPNFVEFGFTAEVHVDRIAILVLSNGLNRKHRLNHHLQHDQLLYALECN